MSRLKFTPVDFLVCDIHPRDGEYVCNRAQEIFDKWPESQPVVYGSPIEAGSIRCWSDNLDEEGDTHTARLVDIQEIKPKKCEHTPYNRPFIGWVCATCEKKLKATFEEIE